MKKIFYTFLLISPLLFISSCEEDVNGCTVASAVNYNSEANSEDGSCLFDSDGDGIYDSDEILGCTDSIACNFNINATDNDNLCTYQEGGYDCEGNWALEIGYIGFGGIVFYIDSTGEHGLVSALEDLEETYEWGCYDVDVDGASGWHIGTGYQNTLDIVNQVSQGCLVWSGETAAQATLDYDAEGYTDWFLPSIYELDEMFSTIGPGYPGQNSGNIGDFEISNYWSSTENNLEWGKAWYRDFNLWGERSAVKTHKFRVRPIRSF